MKFNLTSIFVISVFLMVITACSNSKSPSEGQMEAAQTEEQKGGVNQKHKGASKDSVKKSTFPKPAPGRVAAFFTKYGEENPEHKVILKTRLGDIVLQLYKETPIHRANFIYNVKQDLYDHTIFYRVVPDFMIQGGNSDYDATLEKREEAGAYYIPNEVKPALIHKRGAVAMAMSYTDNPKRKSAQYSYYIVIGTTFNDAELDALESEYDISISASNRAVYRSVGGTPHLDGVHTVFAEVIEGMDVVEAISNEKRDSGDWPVNDVIIDSEVIE